VLGDEFLDPSYIFFAHLVALLVKVYLMKPWRACRLDIVLHHLIYTVAIEKGALHSRLLLVE
jgi:hypothetical protein